MSRMARIGTLFENAITSGESSHADIAALPDSPMFEPRWLARWIRRQIAHIRQPIVHPRARFDDSYRRVQVFVWIGSVRWR